ncbi:GNAT family N-acetyltransferase [Nocardiopsis sp. NPDC058789]|uniref:GNAT family N-acetyltransferase n=1 Tax=Nocardiopsis sp. NPDC058789 TaxID=3346634 RepID=UPI00366A8BAA
MTIIRQARPSDVAVLTRLADSAYGHYVERMGKEPGPMTADYASLVGAGEVWVAEQEGVPVGLLVLRARPDHLLLDNIAVSPSSQGAGVGGRLLDFADDYARARGLTEVRLYTHESMTENLAYYPRRGYVETGRATEHGFRRVFFSKRL